MRRNVALLTLAAMSLMASRPDLLLEPAPQPKEPDDMIPEDKTNSLPTPTQTRRPFDAELADKVAADRAARLARRAARYEREKAAGGWKS